MRKTTGIILVVAGLALLAGLAALRATEWVLPVEGGFLQELVLSDELGVPLPMPFTLAALLVDAGVLVAGRRRLARMRELMILLIVLTTFAMMSDASEVFLRWQNQSAILLAVSIQAIIAIGMTMLLVSGGFDLSVGATAALAGAVAAMFLREAGGAVPGGEVVAAVAAIALALAVGGAVGGANGLIVTQVGINPFITTLGMMGIVRGLLLVMTEGKNITGLPGAFTAIGQGGLHVADVQTGSGLEVWTIQFPILISIVLVGLGDLLLRRTRFFRQNYYIGGNERAAILSGIRVDRMKIFNYVITGMLAAGAGVILTARLGSASVTAGRGLELQVISAVIIGGASLQGGEGTVAGAFLGSILMAIIVSALTLLDVPIYYQELVTGATLLLAVTVDTLGKKRRGAG